MLVIDVECYSNYFLLCAMHIETGKTLDIEMFPGSVSPRQRIARLMERNTTISFNGNGYDLLMLSALIDGYDNDGLKRLSDLIITSNKPSWQIARDANLHNKWNHIDLIDVAPGQASLKVYGGRLGAPRLQDLPIDPNASISEAERERLRLYCRNDLDITARLYRALEKQISLRADMSRQYGMDLRSKSDAQIAETVIKSELGKITGKTYRAPSIPKDYRFRYQDPGIIRFEDPALSEVFKRILDTDFELGKNGSVLMPDWLKAERITIDGRDYQMGIGGLHSCEKRQAIVSDGNHFLAEFDVAGYYPAIILQQGLYPAQLGREFLEVYQSIVERRLLAKKEGDSVTSDTLKISVNGSFGKLGSKYSALYSPSLLIQTTITGQLALLMLIERMAAIGVTTVSANTDGVVLYAPKSLEDQAEHVAWDWMMDTSYTLERTDYSVIASRDVNNYVAVCPNGSIKGKGCFAQTGLSKNPDGQIVYDAVKAAIAVGTPIEKTIVDSRDIALFATVRRVAGGAEWGGKPLGRAVRFYYSTSVPSDQCIRYQKNGNIVPKSAGAMPIMDLPEGFPEDVDYRVYIDAAEKMLCEVGYHARKRH